MAKKIKNTKKVGRCSCCKAKKVSLVPDLGIAICKRCALRMAFALVRNDVLDGAWDDQDTCVACCVGRSRYLCCLLQRWRSNIRDAF